MARPEITGRRARRHAAVVTEDDEEVPEEEEITPVVDGLHPDEIVRKARGPKFFGLKSSQLEEAEKAGRIPKSIPLSTDGRARGWTGRMILDHHARMRALAEQEVAEETSKGKKVASA
jgi:hypothetical protein